MADMTSLTPVARSASISGSGSGVLGQLLGRIGMGIWLGISYGYMLFAAVFVIYISFLSDPLQIPSDFTLRWYQEAFGWDSFLLSLTVSVIIGLIVTIVACVIGTLGALALHRYVFRGRPALSSLFMAPLALPQLILAIGIVILFTRIATTFGFRLTATLLGLVLSHVVVATPWVIRTVGAVLATMEPHLEEAAQSLGASPVRAFFLVTLPILYRGMVGGAIFAFISSFGNLDLSLMIYPPSLQPLPVMLYDQVRATPDFRIAAVSVLTMIIIGGGITIADRVAGLDKAL